MIFDVECDWTAEPEVRRFPVSRAQLAAVAPDVLREVLRVAPVADGSWCWRGSATRSTRGLLFEEYSLELEVMPWSDVTTSQAMASLSFQSGAGRVVAVTWLAMAGFTLPLAHAWHGASLERARIFARELLDRLWKAVAAAVPDSPYR